MQYRELNALIFSIAAIPEAQGQGMGTTLLRYAESRARNKGYRAICLYTNEKMLRNLKLYKREGYIETAREHRSGTAIVNLEKALEAE